MNRLAGFVLIACLLASSGAASGSLAQGKDAHIAPLAIQQRLASVAQPLAAPAASLEPATTSQRVIHAAHASTPATLMPASGEQAAASQGSASACPPAKTDLACRTP
jgi:hypothetical protein